MWEQLPERVMPVGMARVDKDGAKLCIGAKTAKAWKLRGYKTITPNIDRKAHLLGLQFHKDNRGRRKVTPKKNGAAIIVNCAAYLKALKAVPGAYYLLRQDKKGFIIVDMAKPLSR